MTTLTGPPRFDPHGSSKQSPTVGGSDPGSPTTGQASLTAGTAILLISVLAPFGALYAVGGRVTHGDAARTAADIMKSETLFRFGIVSLFVVIALDVVAAYGLFHVFAPVSRGVSMLATAFRLAFAVVFMVAVSQLLGVLRLVGTDSYLASFSPGQLQAQVLLRVQAFSDIWQAALFLFGVHLAIVGYLAVRSTYVPRVVGVLLVVAGAGYVLDSLAVVLSHGSTPAVSTVTFVGEFALALWLVIRGRKLAGSSPRIVESIATSR